MPALYPFQEDAIRRVRAQIRQGHDRILFQLPTGGGKTVVAAEMVRRATAKGFNGLFVVHRDFLVQQSVETISAFGVRCGVIQAGQPVDLSAPMQVAMVQTLSRRLAGPVGDQLHPRVIFWDEAHHVAANTYGRIERHFSKKAAAANHRLMQVGLTATPCRLDGKGLENFQHLVLGPDTTWLIRNGYLSPYRYIFTKTALGAMKKGLSTKMGDFSEHDQQVAVDRKVRVIAGETVDLYLKHAPGAQAMFFAVGVDHSKRTADEFNRRGIPAEHIDGKTLDHHRRSILRRFDAGELKVLTNCNIISEGFDVPAASCVIMGRHTKSVTMALQQVGRALRFEHGKRAVIIDQACNYQNVGFPDTDREWSLVGRIQGGEKAVKRAVIAATLRSCHHCGYMTQNAPEQCPLCGNRMTGDIDVQSVDAEFHEKLSAEIARDARPRPLSLLRGDGTALAPPARPSKPPPYHRIRALGGNFHAILRIFEECGVDNPRRMAAMWTNMNRKRLREERDRGQTSLA